MQSHQLLDQWPRDKWRDRRLVIAVSGGPDSVALLLATAELAPQSQVLAAHFNHHWRGDQSNADQAWVEQLCAEHNIPCITDSAVATPQQPLPPDLNQFDSSGCIQNAMLAWQEGEPDEVRVRSEEHARAERYAFLTRVAYGHGASYVVTGHTADDRVETLLHNLLRGTGLAGAAALRMFRPLDRDLVLVRPLLTKTRGDVMSFLSQRGQAFRTDASNTDQSYRRNFLRGSVLPLVEQNYPQAKDHLLRFAQLTESMLVDCEVLAERWLLDVEHSVGSGVASRPAGLWPNTHYWVAPRSALRSQVWSIVREALRLTWLRRMWPLGAMTHTHWEALRQQFCEATPPLLDQTRVAMQLPGGLQLEHNREYWAVGQPPIAGAGTKTGSSHAPE
jgi:tRNA(Ile)-lysidine synthase